jgi:DNA-directed RNA polymerase subunit RPC12/RpoP
MYPKLTALEVMMLDDGKCPDCGGTRFLEGPHGGMNVNVKCAGCGSKFNLVPGLAGGFGKERISQKGGGE